MPPFRIWKRWVSRHPFMRHNRLKTISHSLASSLKIAVSSMDHPGIVQQVVRILRRYDVNIRSMDTGTGSAPLSGAPIFNMVLEGTVPGGQRVSMVKKDLRALASEMNMDLSFLLEVEEAEG